MKALTILQPYAHLIAIGQKLIENRTWYSFYKGPIAIHAGKGRSMLDIGKLPDGTKVDNDTLIPISDMAFGAIVATAYMEDCVSIDNLRAGNCKEPHKWLVDHSHALGPYCFILNNVNRLTTPIPYKGQLGFFDIPDDIIYGTRMHHD